MANINSRLWQRFSRRSFLQVGSTGLLSLGLPDLLRAESSVPRFQPRAKGMILVWLGGGPATIDMWDPKPEAPAEIRGEFTPIPTAISGIYFSEHMRQTAKILDRCSLIRSLHHNIPDHVPGAQYVMTGNKPNAALDFPSVGSVAAKLLPSVNGMPPYFTIGEAANAGAGFLGAEFNPFRIASSPTEASIDLEGVRLPSEMNSTRLEKRRRFRDAFDTHFRRLRDDADIMPTLSKFQQDALDILASDRIGKAFDVSTEPASILRMYGDGEIGRNALVARRLIEAGARFVTLGTSGWDTHTGNFATLRRLLPPLDQALAALIIDLEQRGILHETIVVCGGEFGRTPHVNAAGGRDHWSRAMTVLISGGGLKRGYVHGSSDGHGFDPTDDGCSPDDFAATLLKLLGFPSSYQLHTAAGRPVELFKYGRTIGQIIA
jgi:Protein of unknown function (DUF1501)